MRTPSSSVISEREPEVLTLVRRGASNKEAARSLYISEATIKSLLWQKQALRTALPQ